MQFQFQNTNVEPSGFAAYPTIGVTGSYVRKFMENRATIASIFSSPRSTVYLSGRDSSQASVSGQAFSQEGYIHPIWDIYPPLNQPRKRELVSCCSGLCWEMSESL